MVLRPVLLVRVFGKTIALTLLVFVLSIGLTVGVSTVFKIRFIEVHGSNMAIVINKDKFTENLLFFPTDTLRASLLREYSLIRSVHVTKKYPSTLVLDIERREPIGVVLHEGRSVLIDRDGVVLGDDHATQIPEIFIPIDDMKIGKKISDIRIQQAISFIIHTRDLVSIHSIHVLDDQSLQARAGTTDISITEDGDLSRPISTLQTLLSGFRIKGIMPKTIDLRFDKPVITW